jgi:DNA-binding XRE family transcriptional regulator
LLAVGDYALGGVPLSPPGGCVVIPPNAFYYSKNAGGAVAKLRHKLKLSQAAFAAALGVSVSALSKWEQGIRKPDKASAKLLSIIEKHPEMLYC